ncbi:hypothetical protein CEXT_322961 [Caerostris extrusa]|uniref:Uncharacterized protein n=1 Tax=Caerostris extrusa TaxID=172846 RepID=A0AAV4N595_CAEEX|nr:hypothetical protein CEXT_322961 [Caerostris extrusa]
MAPSCSLSENSQFPDCLCTRTSPSYIVGSNGRLPLPSEPRDGRKGEEQLLCPSTFSPGQLHEGNSKVEGNLTDSMYRNMFKVNTLAVLGDCLPMFSNIRITVVFGMGYV